MLKEFLEQNKKAVLLLAVFLLLGVAVTVSEYQDSREILTKGVERNEAGGGAKEETFYYQVDGEKEKSLTFSVDEKTLSEKEVMQLLEKAEKDWGKIYLGKNSSSDSVSSSLNLPTSMEDGKVEVTYEFDNYDVIDENGKIKTEKIPKNGLLVQIITEFSCQGQHLDDIRSIMLRPKTLTKEEQKRKNMETLVADKESSSRKETYFQLPENISGHRIKWRVKQSHTGVFILILGVMAVAALPACEKENDRKTKKKRNEQLLLEYPQMLEQISLLLGSGMTIMAAWEKMACRKKRTEIADKSEKLYLEEMRFTWMEMREGRSERECYERFGRRINLEPYRRFSMLLIQNLSKGTGDICGILQTEAKEALEMRKNNAKRLGEEASSKLLGPMMLMFLIILVVVLIPAVMSFNI